MRGRENDRSSSGDDRTSFTKCIKLCGSRRERIGRIEGDGGRMRLRLSELTGYNIKTSGRAKCSDFVPVIDLERTKVNLG